MSEENLFPDVPKEEIDSCRHELPITPDVPEEVWKAIAATQQMQAEETAKAIEEQESVRVAIEKFQETFRERTYFQRHPELGKMVNCAVCGMRHRASQVCEQKFVKGYGPVKPKPRHGMGTGKRMNPHFSWRRLQIIDLTRQLIPYYAGDKAVQKARSKALNILFPIWSERDQIHQQMQMESRAINRSI
jgi:hypothetical protein